jgi:hypothetical protein
MEKSKMKCQICNRRKAAHKWNMLHLCEACINRKKLQEREEKALTENHKRKRRKDFDDEEHRDEKWFLGYNGEGTHPLNKGI